jgi:nitrogen fixation protein FixH
MRCDLRVIGLTALGVVLQCAASGQANAALNYTGQTAQHVSVMYFDLPANTKIVLVDEISGAIVSQGPMASGAGSLAISLAALPSGQYYLLAQQSGQWIAQTVIFYR